MSRKLHVKPPPIAGEHGADLEIQVAGARPRQKRREEAQAAVLGVPAEERIPRITRLMAVAIKFEDMIARGEVRDYADLARLGYVTRARMTQIMNLLHLAPDIQEQLLFLEPNLCCAISERQARGIVAELNWEHQRTRWIEMTERGG
jgi:hypothetical protein